MAKTASGVEYLKSKNVAQIFYDEIVSPETLVNTKRANLWSLGNIGLSELGISYLAADNNIIKTVLEMASSSDQLPLRGTCLQVANMISQTHLGRIILKENNWKVNMLSQGN
jgi:Rapamycin-insensitive companion of mTOR, domain 5